MYVCVYIMCVLAAGAGLGKDGSGITVPVAVKARPDKLGLGADGFKEAIHLEQNKQVGGERVAAVVAGWPSRQCLTLAGAAAPSPLLPLPASSACVLLCVFPLIRATIVVCPSLPLLPAPPGPAGPAATLPR
jgi:hypothetical protein